MLDFLTFNDLDRLGRDVPNPRQLLERAQKRDGKTVFLSHSSKDAQYLPLVIHLLENHGATVYVDVKDDSLPPVPSVETARILRDSLRACRKFVLFVTTNSKDSRWIPWELGLGDGQKSPTNVALIPAAEHVWDQAWANQEFLGLYDRIIWGNFKDVEKAEWMVHDHHTNTAIKLSDWLKR